MDYTLPIGGKWATFSDEQLKAASPTAQAALEERIVNWECNKISMFLPHGSPWRAKEKVIDLGTTEVILPASSYPKAWKNDGVAFMNDRQRDILLLVAQNQGGKTFQGAAKTITHTIPMRKEWPIFTENGVEYHEWTGPKIWIVASYSWDNVMTLWKRYRELLPRNELRNYAPHWGKYDGEKGAQKDLAFGSGRPQVLTLACGTTYKFLCYTQQQMHWEGFEADGGHLDEQCLEEQYVGLNRSFTTRGDYTPIWMTLTGHVMEDRPDTGAGGWIKKKLWDGVDTKGKTIGKYRLDIESTPDAIVSPKRKKMLWEQWANPAVKRSDKQQRAAVARYWGGWEEGSGLWIDIWNRRYHVVPPLWDDDKTPKDWTKWRVIDYGDNGVTCCLWVAVGPKGYAFGYRMLYERGLTIAETCKLISEMSYSRRVELDGYKDETTGNVYQTFEEHPGREEYYNTILDSRSCSQRQQGEELDAIFSRYGIPVTPASGQKNAIQIPRLKEWLRIDFAKEHLTLRDEQGGRVLGSPRLMFFEGRCNSLVDEMESAQRDKNDPSKLASKQADHAIDSCFVAGTMITMADGSRKSIERVAKGDMVLTRGGPKQVEAVGSRVASVRTMFTNYKNELTGTAHHPVWTRDNRTWVSLWILQPGTLLMCDPSRPNSDPYDLRVAGVYSETRDATVFNLQVADVHEYLANGILVHNCKYWASDDPRYMGDQWQAESQTGEVGLPQKHSVAKYTGY